MSLRKLRRALLGKPIKVDELATVWDPSDVEALVDLTDEEQIAVSRLVLRAFDLGMNLGQNDT